MNTLLVIVINYLVAGILGVLLTGPEFIDIVFNAPWLWTALSLGSCFVAMFYLMAITTQRSGTSAAVVANKMSVVIPVIFAFLYFNDDISFLKIAGIILALIGIVFATRNKESTKKWGKSFWLLLILFFGSGAIDTSLKLIEFYYLEGGDVIPFTSALFIMAFMVGVVILSFKAKHHAASFHYRKAFMGIFLGTVNFGSIYFLVLALGSKGMESSVLFPLNNIGVVVLSTLLSIFLFREHLKGINLLGLVLSILALIILMLAA